MGIRLLREGREGRNGNIDAPDSKHQCSSHKESTRLAPRAIGEIGDWLTINQRKVLASKTWVGRRRQVMSYEVLGYQDDYYYYLVPSALRTSGEKQLFGTSSTGTTSQDGNKRGVQ